MKASRAVFRGIKERFSYSPFTMRAMDEKKAKFGIKECLTHQLVHGYPVLQEKEGDLVAHIKFTAMLHPNRTTQITGIDVDTKMVQSDIEVKNKDIQKILDMEI